MIPPVSTTLAAVATDDAARRTRKHVSTIRGIRGVPGPELTKIVARAAETPVALPDDATALTQLFGTAWEDGLVAIGLLATTVRDTPAEALALGIAWAARTDDVATADALGWLVIGPAAVMADDLDAVLGLAGQPRPESRRVAVSAGLAWTPTPIEGPSAAALRTTLGERHLAMVDRPLGPWIGRLCARFVRDANPAVQKAVRRVLRAWADVDPNAVVAWAPTVRGGLPRLLGAVVDDAKAAVRFLDEADENDENDDDLHPDDVDEESP
ncbi:MAG: DNA alkylation repair protein [Myxococcota bacterium]